jgi:hypothetical protein
MPFAILAAVLVAQPAPACSPNPPRQAAARAPATPHPLGIEPASRRLHAVYRRVDGCLVLDVSAFGAGAWRQELGGPAPGVARPASGR